MSTITPETLSELHTIDIHPFVTGSRLDIPYHLTSRIGIAKVADMQKRVLDEHTIEPIEIIVGDDISGRVPTLITKRFLQLAQAGGHTETVPKTFFLASGIIRGLDVEARERQNEIWTNNLCEQAARMFGSLAISRALIITELIGTGDSMERLTVALKSAGIEDVLGVTSLSGLHINSAPAANRDRIAVGLEKSANQPLSHRHPRFEGRKSAELRHFLFHYARIIYTQVFDEEPPAFREKPPLERKSFFGSIRQTLRKNKSR